MVIIPISIILFLLIVVVKILCYYFVDANQKKRKRFQSFSDEEDPADVDAVVGVYLRAMESVTFHQYNEDDLNTQNTPRGRIIASQKQCRVCLVYFKQNDSLLKIPRCDHIFHESCIKKWLVEWQKCPTCDHNIIHFPEDQRKDYIAEAELAGRSSIV